MTYPSENLEQLRDLTLRLADAEESLLKANAFLAAIVESSQEAVVGKNLDGIVQSWNPAAERIYGYTADEMIGQSIEKTVPEDKIEEFRAYMTLLARGEKVGPIHTTRLRKDGSSFYITLSLAPIRARSGEIIGISSIGRPHATV